MKNDKLTEQQIALVVEHMGFAKSLAKQFAQSRENIGFEKGDYEGSAMLGLCDAARRFDPARGQFFKTFAYFRIRGAMYDLLRSGAGVQRRQFNRLLKNQKAAEDQSNASIKSEALSTELDAEKLPYAFARNVNELQGLLNIIDEVAIRLHINGDGEVDLSYAEDMSPEHIISLESTRDYLGKLLERLPEKQRDILELRYFEGMTFDEIGTELGGISKSWISRMHGSALAALRLMIQQDHPAAGNSNLALREAL